MPRGRYNKNKRGRGGGRGGGGGGGGRASYDDNRQSFDQVPKQNANLEKYYNTLSIVPKGEEREAFWTAFRRELPNSFRFCGSKGHALSVRKNLTERFFPILKDIKHEGRPVELPKKIEWYPEGLAYSMTTPKNVVRKYDAFKEFQRFLVSETGVGNISRQEVVSMIPPLVLDVQPHHSVLDLCAAPGSKSAQLIELIHAGEEERVERAIKHAKGGKDTNGILLDGFDHGRSTGLLVANDVNYQRAQMLVHQVKRLNSPNLVVMNHDATMFPSIELPKDKPTSKGKYLKFDRILADVPCSGDGTLRKNPSIWKEWTPVNGLGLYITQVRILVRALQMLKAGGRVVYSTCSMNPIENEAVVSSAIERCGGAAKVKLIDCSDRLPGLRRTSGLRDWSIMVRNGQMYESFAEAQGSEPEGSKVVPGMFPPAADEQIPLERCMRVYPHFQDTGAFFIAVLEKQSEIRAKPEAESKCANRSWTWVKPAEAPVTALVNEIESAETDVNGHLTAPLKTLDETAPGPPPGIDGDNASAAMRQNEPTIMEEYGSGEKRKAEDDLADSARAGKQMKTRNPDDGEDDMMLEGEPARVQRGPLPPSVAMAVEGEESKRTGNAAEANAAKKNDDGVDTGVPLDLAPADSKSEVRDAAKEAPFEKSVPSDLPPPRRGRRNEQPNEESFKYLAPDHPELEGIYRFYELHPAFPRSRFLVRNPAGDPVKGIYYSNQLAKDVLESNQGKGMKFVHAGVKMFMKQDSQGQDICRWRIQTEGLPIFEGWVGDGRVVRLTKRKTLRKLLVEMFPKIGGPEGQEGWRELGEVGEQAVGMGMGCCVLRCEASHGGEDADGLEEIVVLPLWRSLHSLNLMLPKEERKAMLLRIFNEDVPLINHSDPAQKDLKVNGKVAEGSIKAEGDAKELQAKIATDDAAAGAYDNEAEPTEGVAVKDESDLEDELVNSAAQRSSSGNPVRDAQALEAGVMAKEDAIDRAKLEQMEDEDTKVTAAMPERWAEGDDCNTTV